MHHAAKGNRCKGEWPEDSSVSSAHRVTLA
jgi:hypothetical protein